MTDQEPLSRVAVERIGDLMREVWRAGEAVRFYLRQDDYAPWTSPTPAVRRAWDALTGLENLEFLRAWDAHLTEDHSTSFIARLVARRALADCQARGEAVSRADDVR